MARNKELTVFVLDVGASMHPHLENAGHALFTFVEAKILHRPSHEVALVLFGTTGTDNAVHDAFMAEGDAGDFYTNITVQHPLQCPNLSYLTTASNLPRGDGKSEYYEALVVAMDMMVRTVEERHLHKMAKRLVLVSDFEAAIPKVDLAGEDYESLRDSMKQHSIQLELVCINKPGQPFSAAKVSSLALFDRLLSEVAGARSHDVERPEQLMGVFRSKEVGLYVAYKGPLDLGKGVSVQVRVCTKVTAEKMPQMKQYSDKSSAADATHEVERSTEYKLAEEEADEVIPPEDTVKAYRYGKQFVPLDQVAEAALAYKPAKGMQLVGFLPAGQASRALYLKSSQLVLPDPDDMQQASALALLVQACINKQRHAVVRCVLRAGYSPFLGLMVPVAGTLSVPEHFVLNTLPYDNDLRLHYFAPLKHLPEDSSRPSQQQMEAASKLVSSMSLAPGGPHTELLAPEATPNPVLARFYHALGRRALDPESDIPAADSDPLVGCSLQLQLGRMAGAAQALQAAEEQLRTEPAAAPAGAEGAAATAQTAFAQHAGAVFEPGAAGGGAPTQQVGTAEPVSDFRSMVAAGQFSAALPQMVAAVRQLVGSSIGAQLHSKAAECVKELRTACVQQQAAKEFNDALTELQTSYEHDLSHGSFFQLLMSEGVTLVSSAEVPGSVVSEAAAQEYLRLHTRAAAAAAAAGGGGQGAAAMEEEEEEEDDEFAGLE